MTMKKVPYSSLDTPAVLIDMDKLEANIKEMAQAAADAGVELRPHIKIHQCPEIAKMQLAAGACGIEVGNIDQAEVMAEDGINDILIAHPFCGERKLEKLKGFIARPGLKISIVIDMLEQAEGLSRLGQSLSMKIPMLIKIDTGIKRYGVLPGMPTLELARQIAKLPGIDFTGIYAHESSGQTVPTDEGVAKVALEVSSVMAEMARLLKREGFDIQTVATGASPTFRAICRYIQEGVLPDITEIHPGNCVIGDISYMKSMGNKRESCAVTVLTSVMSTSHPGYVVVDAGFKTFGAESIIGKRDTPGFFWNGMASLGSIQGRNDLLLGKLGAESGWLFYTDPDVAPEKKLDLEERLEIVPNNATEVLNIHEKIYGVRNGEIEREFLITGRGRGS